MCWGWRLKVEEKQMRGFGLSLAKNALPLGDRPSANGSGSTQLGRHRGAKVDPELSPTPVLYISLFETWALILGASFSARTQ